MRANHWLALGLAALAAGLAVNSVLGPLATGIIEYHFSETLNNQGIGLDAVSLVLIAPLSLFAAVLVVRGRPAGAVIALGPALYTAYMMIQYVVGPDYNRYDGNNERFVLIQIGLLGLSLAVAAAAWSAADLSAVAPLSRRASRGGGIAMLALAAFLVLGMYAPKMVDALRGDLNDAEYLSNPNAFWIIASLDLGFLVPAAIATGVGLWRQVSWGRKAMYAVLGFLALVGPSVAAMGMTMIANDDPIASTPKTVVFTVYAIIFMAVAVRVFWPLLRRQGPRPRTTPLPGSPAARRV